MADDCDTMWKMATLTLSLLGPFAVSLDERPLTKFTTNRVQALLIYLAVEVVTAPVRRDTLMGVLWPDLPQESAQTNLRQTLYRLRKAIPELSRCDGDGTTPFLLADRQTVQINPNGRFHLDVHQFTKLLKSDECHWPEAVALYRDNFLTDFYLPDSAPFEEWAASQRSALLRQALDALDTLTARSLEAGELDAAETFARRQLELDNLRESAHRQLMEALVRNGRRRAALSHYETCRQLLRDELDIEPTLETQKLYEAIRTGQFDGASAPASAADLAPLPKARKTHNLPRQTTTFFGREAELQTLHAFLADPAARLITIVGPGGMGKTRLALETARQQLAAFEHGVWFASLAKLASPEEIVPATAQALQFSFYEGREPRQQLLDYLRNKSLLLVMDNYEHLLDGVDLVADVLQTAPQVKVLATSREPLRLVEEQLFPLSGLAFSREDVMEGDAAVQLFLERARHLRPDLTLKADDIAHITTICQQVEGMPLGLELAAAWADTLSLAEIAAELQGSLDLLESDLRNIADRHRSLRAVFEASWDRLQPGERRLFAQLSVFRGGFTRTAAKAICAPDVSRPAFHRLLAALTRKSFLKHDMENGRYDIHELMRQFGAEKLAQESNRETETRDHHCAYFCQALDDKTDDWKGGRQKEAMSAIEADIENMRAAWDWAVAHKYLAQLYQAAFILASFYRRNGRYLEGESAFRSAADMCRTVQPSDEQILTRAYLLFWLGSFISSWPEQIALIEECLSQMGRLDQADAKIKRPKAEMMYIAGFIAAEKGEPEKGRQLLQKSLTLFQEIEDSFWQTEVLTAFANVLATSCEYDLAEQYIAQSLNMQRQSHNQFGTVFNLASLGYIYLNQSLYQQATQCFQEALTICRDLGGQSNSNSMLLALALTKIYQYDSLDEAERLFIECLAFYKNFGFRQAEPQVTSWLACIKVLERRAKEAESLAQSALDQAREMRIDFWIAWVLCVLSYTALSTEDFSKAQTLAQEAVAILYDLKQPSEFSNGLVPLGWALVAQAKYRQAEQPIYETLKRWTVGTYNALPLAACVLAHRVQTTADKEYALRLFGLYEQAAPWAKAPLFQFLTARFLPDHLFGLPAERMEAIKAEGRALDPKAAVEGLRQKLTALGWSTEKPEDTSPQEGVCLPESFLTSSSSQGRFVQESLLAVGSHGTVYLGQDTSTGQLVVIKQLKSELIARQPEMVSRFIREGEALRQLNHPNIVTMLAAEERDGAHLIIMEYVPGGSLRDLLDTAGQLPLQRVLDIGLELADALTRAHHLGIIHRDIKPANVLLAADGTPRLTDFGIAHLSQRETRLTQAGSFMGSPVYMSPEACRGEALDFASDIWSFGALLYEMLAGQPPFANEQIAATLVAILNDPVPGLNQFCPDLPLELETLINSMLIKEREKRINSVRQVAAKLETIQNNLTTN